jgi:hypothetical protein
MKGIYTSILLLLLCSTINAQNKKGEKFSEHLYLSGGVNFVRGNKVPANDPTNFKIGLLYNVPLSQHWSLQPGLYFTERSFKTSGGILVNGTPGYTENSSTTPKYLEVPVNVVGKINLRNGWGLFGGGSPYAAMGIAGKYKYDATAVTGSGTGTQASWFEITNDNVFKKEPIGSYGDTFGYLNRWDFGLNFLGGVYYKRISLGFNYGYGLSTITQDKTDIKYRIWTITAGIRL